jgi:hypothetical protein
MRPFVLGALSEFADPTDVALNIPLRLVDHVEDGLSTVAALLFAVIALHGSSPERVWVVREKAFDFIKHVRGTMKADGWFEPIYPHKHINALCWKVAFVIEHSPFGIELGVL